MSSLMTIVEEGLAIERAIGIIERSCLSVEHTLQKRDEIASIHLQRRHLGHFQLRDMDVLPAAAVRRLMHRLRVVNLELAAGAIDPGWPIDQVCARDVSLVLKSEQEHAAQAARRIA